MKTPNLLLLNQLKTPRRPLPRQWLLERLRHLAGQEPLPLEEVAFVLVPSRTMARVHREFLGVPGTTDVITFHHGEILVCPDVAAREAAARHIPFREELLRYCVHGWLHLRGMDDHAPDDTRAMHARQECLVKQLSRPLTSPPLP